MKQTIEKVGYFKPRGKLILSYKEHKLISGQMAFFLKHFRETKLKKQRFKQLLY